MTELYLAWQSVSKLPVPAESTGIRTCVALKAGYGVAAWRVELREESSNTYEKIHSVQEDLLT